MLCSACTCPYHVFTVVIGARQHRDGPVCLDLYLAGVGFFSAYQADEYLTLLLKPLSPHTLICREPQQLAAEQVVQTRGVTVYL